MKVVENVLPGYSYVDNIGVMPDKQYPDYSTVFMGAMHKPKMYLHEILGFDRHTHQFTLQDGSIQNGADFYPKEITLDNCIRLDALVKSGKSKKHLINFFMLGISGYMSYEQGIIDTYTLLSDMLGEKSNKGIEEGGVELKCVIHPDDLQSNFVCNALGIKHFFNETCFFENNKTDRTGFRVEFIAKFKDKEGATQTRELINLVKISKLGGKEPNASGQIDLQDMCIFEGGGAWERVLGLVEGVDDVFATSKFTGLSEYDIPKNIVDLLYALYSMKVSGYELGNKDRRKKTYRELVLKLGYIIIEMDKLDINLGPIVGLIQNSLVGIVDTSFDPSDWDAENNYLDNLFTQYKSLYQGVEQIYVSKNIDEGNFQKACVLCNSITGGKTGLLRIVFQKLGIDEDFSHQLYEDTLKNK